MASASLSDLPSELILKIFKSFDDHRTITALNLTCRKFQDIWQLNTASIVSSVLPQSIDCFDLAQELLIVQGKSDGAESESREALLERCKCLVTNASTLLKYYSRT